MLRAWRYVELESSITQCYFSVNKTATFWKVSDFLQSPETF